MSKALFQTKKLHLPSSYQKLLSVSLILLFSILSHSQQILSFTNEQAESLIGVEVFTEDFSFSEISNSEGLVSIPAEIPFVICRYLGYEETEVEISGLNKIQKIVLKTKEVLVDEVTIIGRTGVLKEETPYHIETIDSRKIQLVNTQTSADALAAHSNVYVQKSQMGGGSPVLRGFEANKILLVIDGVRLNNAIYRSGHLQNAISIDQAVLERMEVVFGAGSLNYGSDALGGVIHFRSKEPKLVFDDSKSYMDHGFYLRHASANREKSIHYDLSYGNKKWASLSSITFSDFKDLTSGNRYNDRYPDFGKRPDYVITTDGIDSIAINNQPNRQIGTGYHQLDLLQKLVFKASESTKVVLNGQYSTSSDVPRYDRLTERSNNGDLSFAEWYYGPQNRLLLSSKIEHIAENTFFNKALLIASYQKIDEDRIDRNFQSDIRSTQEEDVDVLGLTIDFNKNLRDDNRHVLKYGFDFQHNKVESEAYEENINSGEINFNVLSRYPSNSSSLMSYGIYGLSTWKNKKENLITNIGLRYNSSTISLTYDDADPFPWPQSFIDGLKSTNSSIVASAGLNYNTSSNWQWHSQLSSAYRSPNIDDMAKIRVKGNEVSVPNLMLNPEKSLNAEIGFTKKGTNQNYFQVAVYYTILDDVIIREPLPLPDGSTFIINGLDTLMTQGNVNAEQGYVYGFTTNASYTLYKNLKWNGSLNYTYGRARNGDIERPLSHIPPLFGKTGVDWSYERFELSAVMRFNGKKDIIDFGDSTDNPEQATPEGSLAWQTYNVYMSYPYYDWLKLSIGVENILNTHYRNFASGVSAPGMNFILSLRGNF